LNIFEFCISSTDYLNSQGRQSSDSKQKKARNFTHTNGQREFRKEKTGNGQVPFIQYNLS